MRSSQRQTHTLRGREGKNKNLRFATATTKAACRFKSKKRESEGEIKKEQILILLFVERYTSFIPNRGIYNSQY